MKRIGKLRHLAAGLQDSFVNRNNDVQGHWALGKLYADAPGGRVVLDLLRWEAAPATPTATTMARNYGERLRRALPKLAMGPDDLVEATVEVTFNTPPALPPNAYRTTGEPFDCVFTLRNRYGQTVVRPVHACCQRYQPYLFSGRGA
ncbi:hypothetical protein [Pseudoduganella armeniaca]|uniref:hypothetical protein n=1 Tax=Pseudoduganella armeniaca TaxID=2072590 RepID=UPI0011B24068|nr:hypothetical protein [Pseudoduganella armeniaca]